MYKVVMLTSLFAVSAYAGGYGYGGAAHGAAYGTPYGGAAYGAAPVLLAGPAAIATHHTGSLAVHTQQHVNYLDVPNQGYVQPTSVNVDSQPAPIFLNFRTASSPVNIQHHHASQPGSFRATESFDEPHRHVHTVTKPIIQELREIISPQRIVRQQVQPVQEEIQTQVARQIQAAPVLAAPAPAAAVVAAARPLISSAAPLFAAGPASGVLATSGPLLAAGPGPAVLTAGAAPAIVTGPLVRGPSFVAATNFGGFAPKLALAHGSAHDY